MVFILLGFFSMFLIYFIFIFLGIFKVKCNNEFLDVLSSVVIIVVNVILVFLFVVVFIVFFVGGNYWYWFFLKGLVSDNFESLSVLGKIKDYLWYIILFVFCIFLGGFVSFMFLVKNFFLDEMGKFYVVSVKVKGCLVGCIFYVYVFCNVILLVVVGFL